MSTQINVIMFLARFKYGFNLKKVLCFISGIIKMINIFNTFTTTQFYRNLRDCGTLSIN